MGLEPLRAEAKRTLGPLGRGPLRATGAPSVGVGIIGSDLAGVPLNQIT